MFVLFFILKKIVKKYSALPYFRVYMSYIYIYNIPLHLFFLLFAECVFFFLQGCNTALIERCAGGDGLVDREREYTFLQPLPPTGVVRATPVVKVPPSSTFLLLFLFKNIR